MAASQALEASVLPFWLQTGEKIRGQMQAPDAGPGVAAEGVAVK